MTPRPFQYLREAGGIPLAKLIDNTRSVLASGLDKADSSNFTFQGLNWAPMPGMRLIQSNVVTHYSESDKSYKTVIDFLSLEVVTKSKPAVQTPAASRKPADAEDGDDSGDPDADAQRKAAGEARMVFEGLDDNGGLVMPSFSQTPVRVSCSCSAYYFYFAWWNMGAGAHARGRMRQYVPVVNPKRQVGPLNPRHLPGLCKHLAAYAEHLRDLGMIED